MHHAKETTFLESVDLCFDRAADAMDLPNGLARQIRTCLSLIHISEPTRQAEI